MITMVSFSWLPGPPYFKRGYIMISIGRWVHNPEIAGHLLVAHGTSNVLRASGWIISRQWMLLLF